MKTITMCAAVVGLVLPTLAAVAGPIQVTVSAGEFDRTDTPVFVDLKLTADQMKEPISVVADGKVLPAQIEPLADGQARVWWIVDSLPKGATRGFEIKPGRGCQGFRG